MSWLGRKWGFWVALFSRRERGLTLAVTRIAVASALCYSLLSPLSLGIVDDLFVHQDYGGIRRIGGSWLMQLLGGATPSVLWTLYGTSLALTLALVVGFGGRWVPLLLLQTYGGIVASNPYASGGYDDLFTNALWLMVLGDTNRTLSVDCKRRTGRWSSDEAVMAWPRYLLVFQLLLMYTSTGLRKNSVVWLPTGGYSALYYALMDPNWTRYDFSGVAWIYPLTQVMSALTVHWEQLSCLLLVVFYFRYTRERPGHLRAWANRFDLRKPWALVGVGLHVSILVLLDVGPFSWISLAYYPCLFHPDEVEAGLRRLGRIGRRLGRVGRARPAP